MKNAMISALSFLALTLTGAIAFAAEHDGGGGGGGAVGLIAIAVALGIGIAAAGGAYGQSRAASAALEGIARNPNASDKVFVPMILGLAFIESLVLFTWVLMLLVSNNIGTILGGS